MKFYEVAEKLSKLIEEDTLLSRQDILNIANKAYEDDLHIDPEEEEGEVNTLNVGGEKVQRIGSSYICICSLETYKNIISDYVSNFTSVIVPDGIDDYIDRQGLYQAALSDQYILTQLSKLYENQYGAIIQTEEVEYNGKQYIVMEIS